MTQYFISKNPITGETLWKGPSSSQQEIDSAISLARKVFPIWSNLSLQTRIEILLKFKESLELAKLSFAEIISKETGKPLWESKTEVDSMVAKVDISIKAYRQRCPEFLSTNSSISSITRHKPHGVAAVFGPFNFPGHLPNGHIVPALLAGNTVIFKPSELTPLVGEEMVKLWKNAGLPEGVINLVQGGAQTGSLLAMHSDLNALFFTGSWRIGKLLSQQFGAYPEKILALEMGGNNPLIIGKISNYTAAAYHTTQAAFLTAGQRCTCARRLILIGNENIFLKKLISIMKGIRVGAYTESPEPFMGPVINEEASIGLLSAQEKMIQIGGEPLVLMRKLKVGTPLLSPGLIDVTAIKERDDEELFGPLLQVIRVSTFEAAIAEANNTTYGLTASILTDSREEYETFLQLSRAGIVNWNTSTTGASSSAPFGGRGRSGNHRPSAFYAADYCSYPVASLENQILTLPSSLLPGISIQEAEEQL
jgi:succinylglutamic semialdehyde dehydrogenase